MNRTHSKIALLLPVVTTAFLCLIATPVLAVEVMYGGLGGHNNGDSTNDGSLAIVNQLNGSVGIVGHPGGVNRLTGLAFDPTGTLFASTISAGGFPPPSGPRVSNLITINADTGQLLSSAAITTGANISLAIADLAIQPGTNTLFGITSPDGPSGPSGTGQLYTINRITGVATFVGNTGNFFGSIAFAPNGTLYMSAADLNFSTSPPTIVNKALKTINPLNGMTLTSVPTNDFFGAFGIRADGTIFGGNGDEHELFTINPLTGAETLIGDTGRNFVGALAFRPGSSVPESGATLSLMFVALAGLAAYSRSLGRLKKS